MSGDVLEFLDASARLAWYAPQVARDVYKRGSELAAVAKRLRGSNPEFSSPEHPPPMPKRHYPDDSYGDEDLITGTRAPLKTPKEHVTPLARRVQACCLQERALYDARSSASVSAGGEALVCLNDGSQGTDVTGRTADISYMKHLLIRGMLTLPSTQGVDAYRMTIVIDKECFGNLCTYAQVFHTATTGDLINSLFEYGNRTRFVPILDKTWVLTNPDVDPATGGGVIKEFEISIPLRFSTKYSGNAGTIGDIVANSLCVMQSSRYGAVFAEWKSLLIYRS